MFFVGSLNWGGAEKVISLLAHSYLERGYEVYLVTVLSNKKVYELDRRIKYLSIARPGKSNLSNVSFWVKSIKNLFLTIKPSIVVSFVCRINLLVIKAKQKAKINCRLIISERNDPKHDTRGCFARILLKSWYPKADLLICQTIREKQYFSKKIQDISVVIPNPSFLSASPTPFEDKKKIIINAARYDVSKNQKLLIDAYGRIVDKQIDDSFELHFYGTGSIKSELVNYIKTKGLSNKIKVFDSIPDVQQKISEASIFCLSSNYEGMSNALMEALLLGTPAISTDTSGAMDLIEQGKNGIIVPVGDVNKLEETLATLINNNKMRHDMYNYCLTDAYQDRFKNALDQYQKAIDGE